jgi:hypothetical protein
MTVKSHGNDSLKSIGATFAFAEAVAPLAERFRLQYNRTAFFDVDNNRHIYGMSEKDARKFINEDAPDLFERDGRVKSKPSNWLGWAHRSNDGWRGGVFLRRDVDTAETLQTLYHEFFHVATENGAGPPLVKPVGYADTSKHHSITENAAEGGALLALHTGKFDFDWLNWHEDRSAGVAMRAIYRGDIAHLSSFTIDRIVRDARRGWLDGVEDDDIVPLADAYAVACTPPDKSLRFMSDAAQVLRGHDHSAIDWPETLADTMFKAKDDIYVHYVGAKLVRPWFKTGFSEFGSLLDSAVRNDNVPSGEKPPSYHQVDFSTPFWREIGALADRAERAFRNAPSVPVDFLMKKLRVAGGLRG